MESLLESGLINAVLDITTTELMDEVAGGTLSAGPERLDAAGALDLPQVVSVGASDQVTFSPPEAIPAAYRDRTIVLHNANVGLVRSNAAESAAFGTLLAEKLNRSRVPVTLFVPLSGSSSYSVAGAAFRDPVADAALISSLRTHLAPSVELIEMEVDINDPRFADAMAERLGQHYRTWMRSHANGVADRPSTAQDGSEAPG